MTPHTTPGGRIPIVGLGASAGGLEALGEFLSCMPADSGMAFVVVTHQHADHPSMLAELLARKTEMPVVRVSRPTPVAADHVYTLEPGKDLAILGGVLQPMEADPGERPHMPVDYFFRSLARDQGELAIGIVLSGTGSDGALGLKEIKGSLGMVMVQDEQSARYAGMPRSAIATEVVDHVLPVKQRPQELLAWVRALPRDAPDGKRDEPPLQTLQQIFVLIRDRTGHDFSQYKRSTISRRIERRMHVHQQDSIAAYVAFLMAHPTEIDLLVKELLIGVTAFFREPEAWDVLSDALKELLRDKPDGHLVRAWIAGCSTGEEAYSLAIVVREVMDALGRSHSVQIFATDLDEHAIHVARGGIYSVGVARDISAERLARFFNFDGDTYRVKKEIREMLVFAPHDLVVDPPFTKLDLLSCRNLLIYLDSKLQKRLLPLFHYALRPGGLLFLGSSESLGTAATLFTTIDKKQRVFRRREVAPGTYVAEFPASGLALSERGLPASADLRVGTTRSIDRLAQKMLLADLVPPTVLVHERGDVAYVHGRTGLFLEPAEGAQATANLFNMAREGLQLGLTAAIRQAASHQGEVVRRAQVAFDGGLVAVDLRVSQLREPEALRGLFRITFDHAHKVDEKPPEASRELRGREQDLQRELRDARESHQGTVEELETANEELKSTNEELQSTNEELQSANEELETSREEMQSLNEELQTVNAELQGKVDELSHANNDMKNLLNGTDIATVFLDNQLRIKRFTDQARRVIRLIPSDVGRHIGDLASSLHYDHLVADAQRVLDTLVFSETSVQAENEATYLMRILPYRTTENVIDGLVLTFIDMSRFRKVEEENTRLSSALEAARVGLVDQDAELRITWAFNNLLPQVEAEHVAELKRRVLATGAPARERLELDLEGRRQVFELYIEARRDSDGKVVGLTSVAMDIGRVGDVAEA